ncbi:hypothetical protein Lalb_Chr25g0283011 [Lupinus albus]|uniref:Uncharacterized protein n=1 Tax=Lupinus albus TaxID=3870 RepID=A0A6A4N7J0_LUPAL|nr:hypothetical protein Lalb_Chr25g0283011 [Lupinus albus]
MYLGILVGANQGSTSTWTNVIDAMARRLAPWSRKHISFGGRVIFMNSVLYIKLASNSCICTR